MCDKGENPAKFFSRIQIWNMQGQKQMSKIQVHFQTLLSGLKPATEQADVSTRWEDSGQKMTLFVRVNTVAPVRNFHLGNITQLLTKGQRVTSPTEPTTFSFQYCGFDSFILISSS